MSSHLILDTGPWVALRLCGSLQVDIEKPGACWAGRRRFRWMRACGGRLGGDLPALAMSIASFAVVA